MVDLDEMMDKINNINSRVEELYSKEVYNNKEALNSIYGVNSDCYLKSCIAQQAKEITLLTRQVDNQKDTIKNMGDNIIAIAKERDNLAASLETEKAHAKTCNDNFYEYRLSSNGTIKGYQQELEKVRSERDTAKVDVKVLNKNHQALGEQYNDLMRKYDEVRSERDTVRALNEQLRADFDVLAKNHKELGEQYHDLQRQLCDELKDKEDQIKMLKLNLKDYKIRYANKTIAFNRLNGEYLDLQREYNNLATAADKYSWKRVDCLTASTLEDHCLYLFAVDGYSTPVKGRFHGDSLSHISIIVDDGKGKGPEQKIIFFMDGHIRYWTPLPEMPDMPEGVDDDDSIDD